MNKFLAILLMLTAVFLAYAFAAATVSLPGGQQVSLGAKLSAPFYNLKGASVIFFVVGCGALLCALYFALRTPRSAKAEGDIAGLNGKSNGLEIGFLFSGIIALVVLALMVLGSAKAWFDNLTLGALGSIFVIQIVMGVVFLVLFIKKEEKAVLPFIPAIIIFVLEVAIGVLGVVAGLK